MTRLGPQGHGTVGGAEIEFFRAGGREPEPAGLTMAPRLSPLVERKGEDLLQALRIDLESPYAETFRAAVKIYGTETVIDIYRLLMDVLGVIGTLQKGSPGALLEGRIEEAWRGATINTYGGGVNEVQRSLVASLGLRMPRTGR